MRWLAKYPITAEEVLATIEKIPEDNPPGTPPDEICVGGVNDMIRRHLIDYVKANMEQVLESLKVK